MMKVGRSSLPGLNLSKKRDISSLLPGGKRCPSEMCFVRYRLKVNDKSDDEAETAEIDLGLVRGSGGRSS